MADRSKKACDNDPPEKSIILVCDDKRVSIFCSKAREGKRDLGIS